MNFESLSSLASGSRLGDRYALHHAAGWLLLGIMILCCLCLSLADLPAQWHVVQNLAALLQAFVSGIVVAQWLPIWQPLPDAGPAAEHEKAGSRLTA